MNLLIFPLRINGGRLKHFEEQRAAKNSGEEYRVVSKDGALHRLARLSGVGGSRDLLVDAGSKL